MRRKPNGAENLARGGEAAHHRAGNAEASRVASR